MCAFSLVQFPHPGGEHGHDPGKPGIKNWNTKKHKRKFLKQNGKYLDSNNKIGEASLVFWGEWEPQSIVTKINDPLSDLGPHFIHMPFIGKLPDYGAKGSCGKGGIFQNTDPFIFGEQFFYGICKQTRRRNDSEERVPTKMRFLEKGSVILFGFNKGSQFLLDTVFVIGDYFDYKLAELSDFNMLKHAFRTNCQIDLPQEYFDVTLEPLRNDQPKDINVNSDIEYRLYIGATFDDRQKNNGMFSFFPCLRGDEVTRGFERPKIELGGLQAKSQNFHLLGEFNNIDEVKKLWAEINRQVLDDKQGLMLGTWTEMPKRKD